jgi:hypothetical protein
MLTSYHSFYKEEEEVKRKGENGTREMEKRRERKEEEGKGILQNILPGCHHYHKIKLSSPDTYMKSLITAIEF